MYRAARESSPPTVSHRPGLVWEGLAQGTIVYTDPPGSREPPLSDRNWNSNEEREKTVVKHC